MHKPVEPVGDSGGGDADKETPTDLVNAEENIGDAVPVESCKIVRDDIDDNQDDADGEADDDEERY